MASGTITNKWYNNYSITVSWSSTATQSSNSSVVKATISLYCPYGLYIGSRTGTITINGVSYAFDGSAISTEGGTITLATVTSRAISHNADGSKTISISCSYPIKAYMGSANVYVENATCSSNNCVLDKIARAATLLTAPNFNDTANPTITYSNPAGTAATLAVAIYNSAGTASYVPYKTDVNESATSYTFNLTEAERENLRRATPNSNSLAVRFYLRTTIGSSNYYSYLDRTLTITDANPVIAASVVDTNDVTIALTGDSSKLIKYYSNAKATMSATAQKHATINTSEYAIKNGTETVEATEHTFNNVESNVFTFSATDSRKNTGTATVKPTMVDYEKLTCNISNNKPDADGDMTVFCYGDCFFGSFGAVENTLIVQYRYKVTGGTYGDWVDMTITEGTGAYWATADLSGLDYKTSYTFQTRATDKLDSIESAEITVRSIPVYHWGENDFAFEVPVDFKAGWNMEGKDVLDYFFPVNSIVIRYDHTSPAELFGGVWTRVLHSKGTPAFLYGCTEEAVIGECGGESSHTLTVNEMPSHRHNFTGDGSAITQNDQSLIVAGSVYPERAGISKGANYSSNGSVVLSYTGGGEAHNNMPPYIKVSIWRRTA